MAYPKLTPVTATGSTAPRYLGDRFADIVNVKDFGAKGDGVADDTAAFTAAQESGAQAVMVPNGTYKITEDVAGTFFSFGEITTTGGGDVEIIDILTIDTDTTYSPATQSVDGLMSAADKQKLDAIATSAGKYTLVTTWHGSSSGDNKWISKTITGCTVGEPVILGFSHPSYNGVSDVLFRITAGCDYGRTGGTSSAYSLSSGSHDGSTEGVLTAVLIPTASTISMDLYDFEDDEDIYIYMQ